MTQKQKVKTTLQQLMQLITADKALIKRSGLARTDIEGAVRREEWEKELPRLTENSGRVVCGDVLKLCESTLNRLAPCPEEGWLTGCYHFLRYTMFDQQEYLEKLNLSKGGFYLFLSVLRYFLEKEHERIPFDPMLDFDFLSDEEALNYPNGRAYLRFKNAWKSSYVYEMLRLGEETMPFHTLSHISGVHYVATEAARGLLRAGVPVDLALAGAAAAGHDIGKFGCRPGERVPYLHYYYTDEWFHRRDLDAIGHIAANHSTWDLEFENLTVESFCLIYADFRVKQAKDEEGREFTRIFSLKESFDVILSKLDNVDEKKLKRYKVVYARLKSFEDWMRSLGVDTALDGTGCPAAPMPDISLRSAADTLQSLNFMGIEHNLKVMHILSTERQFGNLLEAARSEKNWKHIRAYLNVFREYSTYLSFEQKRQTIGFLYELLMHREGDIRRFAAMLIGQLIAEYNAGYRKEHPERARDRDEVEALALWNETLDRITRPDHKLMAVHKLWLGYTFKIVVSSLFALSSGQDAEMFFKLLMQRYEVYEQDEDTAFALLDALYDLPLKLAEERDLIMLVNFAGSYFSHPSLRTRIAAERFIKNTVWALPKNHPALDACRRFTDSIQVCSSTDLYLQYRILSGLGEDTAEQQRVLYHTDVARELFLDNLKSATPWILKAVNIKLLVNQVENGCTENVLHIATHLSNLIKVSQHVVVRIDAGNALLKIVSYLTPDQRNEIAVELVKGLEVGEYEFSKYIPACLGKFALWLPPEQLNEICDTLRANLASANERIASVALETVGVMLGNVEEYTVRFGQTEEESRTRRIALLGILLSGMANYRLEVRQEAMWALSRFFAAKEPSDELKRELLSLSYRKILFLMGENCGGELDEYYRAALLSQVCRVLNKVDMEEGGFATDEYERVAFFPGTFDPFTLSHKAIVKLIRDLGYEVYLAVDEFSWSKNTQPHLIRRQIVNMSVADEFHVHLFPDNIPVNIANPSDLDRLRNVFAGRKLYLVCGGDVIRGASAYRNPPTPGSVHSLNHILFSRAEASMKEQEKESWKCITGEVVHLELPPWLEDVSSTRIRENIDLNRDISSLIDPVVQEYIYSDSRYLREPKFKIMLEGRSITRHYEPAPTARLLPELSEHVLRGRSDEAAVMSRLLKKEHDLLVLRRADDEMPTGFASMREITGRSLLEVLGSVEAAEEVRQKSAAGRILVIDGIYSGARPVTPDPEQWLLALTITEGLAHGCNYALFICEEPLLISVRKVLERQGFTELESATPKTVYGVDMRSPLVLLHNLHATFKAPFDTNTRLRRAVTEAHARLQMAMTNLYPGQLVLSLPFGMMLEEMVTRMTEQNGVPRTPTQPRKLGPYMCVPFGKLMRSRVVPNTVTKTLHTDLRFTPSLESSKVVNYPGYTDLESQIRVIKSFGRPVVLLDDILHRPGRLNAVLPLFEKEGVEVKGVLVGVVSGRGRDLIDSENIPVESVFSIPTVRRWFLESTLYPFIGGDAVERTGSQVPGLEPSVNFIMPYAVPAMEGCSLKALYEFSECCLKNARDVFLVLEREYRRQFGRNLTLSRLNDAVILPLCPDKGSCLSYDPNLSPSVYLENDLDLLARQRRMLLSR